MVLALTHVHIFPVVSGRFFWIRLGTKLYPSRIFEKPEMTKVVSTISACIYENTNRIVALNSHRSQWVDYNQPPSQKNYKI